MSYMAPRKHSGAQGVLILNTGFKREAAASVWMMKTPDEDFCH